MSSRTRGSLENPLPCKSVLFDHTRGGGNGCGLFLFIAFGLAFIGFGAIGRYNGSQFEQRSEVIPAHVLTPPVQHFQHPDGHTITLYPEGQRLVEFTPADGKQRRVSLPGKYPLDPGSTLAVRWSAAGRGRIEAEQDFRERQASQWIPIGIGGLILISAVLMMRRWRADNARRQRLLGLNQRLPVHSWTVRHYHKGKGRFDRWRLDALFQVPDGRWYRAESEEFISDPQPRMHGCNPQILLDPQRPELSLLAMDSLPPVT